MRIGLILAKLPGYSETFFQTKIRGLQEAGHQVIIFAPGLKKEFSLCKHVSLPIWEKSPKSILLLVISFCKLLISKPLRIIEFVKAELDLGRSFFITFRHLILSSYILSENLDWVHFGFATLAIGKESVARSMGAKMAISHRGYDINVYPLKFSGCYQLLWERTDSVHVLSDAILKKAISFGLNCNKRVMKIYPAINTNYFECKTKSNIQLNNNLTFLTISRLKWVKGLDYTLEALAILKKNGLMFKYTIIGDGDDLERLAYSVYQLDLISNVIFLGKQNPEVVKECLKNSDIYLQYSISEGFCNAVLEAQAMGCLCVVSNADGLPENVLHQETGWVVPKRNPKLLANQILEIIQSDTDKLNNIRKAAISRINNEFNLRQQQDAFLSFYLD
jgi:colanic acid/amylovoran biosynthesis glycosyltransferase